MTTAETNASVRPIQTGGTLRTVPSGPIAYTRRSSAATYRNHSDVNTIGAFANRDDEACVRTGDPARSGLFDDDQPAAGRRLPRDQRVQWSRSANDRRI